MSSSSSSRFDFVYDESDYIYQTSPWGPDSSFGCSRFDEGVWRRWDKAMENGAFRYNIHHITTRILPGPKEYVARLNVLRAIQRRSPQIFDNLRQPFNPEGFNFTWVKDSEIVFKLKNRAYMSQEKIAPKLSNCDENHQTVITPPGNDNVDTTSSGKKPDAQEEDEEEDEDEEDEEDEEEAEEEEAEEEDEEEAEDEAEECHTLVINVSPMEYGHCLLCPHRKMRKPQVLTLRAISVAIETMMLSSHRGFRMGFNSLCGFASVNHLHFHCFYLDHEMISDHCPVQHLGGHLYEFTALPCPGFALQVHGSTVHSMARLTYKMCSYFQNNDVPHNIFICRGTVFGEPRNSPNTTMRLFIWPRKKFTGNKSSIEFNVACLELAGYLPIKIEERFQQLTESYVDKIIEGACLPDEEYRTIRADVTKIAEEDMEISSHH